MLETKGCQLGYAGVVVRLDSHRWRWIEAHVIGPCQLHSDSHSATKHQPVGVHQYEARGGTS